MLQIINDKTKTTISLNSRDSINLELCLNVTKYGNEWKHIGDVLYDFGTERLGEHSSLVVTDDQFRFLMLLKTKNSWRDCIDLSLYP
jgi:hypothetical protein